VASSAIKTGLMAAMRMPFAARTITAAMSAQELNTNQWLGREFQKCLRSQRAQLRT
jgi:hypothetical protein